MSLEFRNLGDRLRHVRRSRMLRLKDVAGEVGCSESLISKIECNKATPSLRILHRIAAVLDTSVGSLFADDAAATVTVYRNGERPAVVIGGPKPSSAIRLERLVPRSDIQALDGNVHVVAPGADNGGEIRHAGEELGYVIEGQLELTVGEWTFLLQPGDSFYFRSELPHRYRNPGTATARVLWINAPPTF